MTQDVNSKTILIIDDEEDVVSYLETFFQDNGFDTLGTTDGQKGLDLAREHKPDLICLDISMPAPTGVKVYRELCDDQDLSSIPVVMVTGVQKEFEQFIKTRRQVPPPAGYVSKPFDAVELLEQVKSLLKMD